MVSAEQREITYNHYCMSFDFDIAVLKAGLNTAQIDELKNDENFMLRLKLEDAEIQTEIMTSLRAMVASENEAVKMRATLELGNVLYKKRFKVTGPQQNVDDLRPTAITLVGKKP